MNHAKEATPCRGCGALIVFIQTKNTTWMPVEKKLFVAQRDDKSKTLILSDGTIQHGVERGDVGHEPHWVDCGEAGRCGK